ncbi:MAG TPA: efflux RND transporter periplasmic adaptor subunit [Verrucomicrobiae bacterium]|nr:efflux RND transporter periplasmic adaptor subunit [Verrucomicrobiae bacterium]
MILIARACAPLVAGLIALTLAGCKRSAGNDHEHDDKTAQITVWTNGYEIFAEHRAPVVGKPMTFVIHVTDLETLEPRREGPVKFLLKQDGSEATEHVQPAPARPGIYLPGLTFPKAGKWQIQLAIQEHTISLGSVDAFADPHDAAHAEFPEPPEGISFLKEQQWKILSKAEPVTKRLVVEHLRLPATVTPRPGSLAAVTPPIAGRLLPAAGKAMPILSERVEAGQTLALLQPAFSELAARFVEAEGEVTRSRLVLEEAQTNLVRIRKLAEVEAKSARELQEAEFAFKSAQARHEAALALQATYRNVAQSAGANVPSLAQPSIELKSPIAGVIVKQLGAAVGEYIPADKSVFTILDANKIFIEAKVSEASLPRLSETRQASYEQPGADGRLVPVTGEGGGHLVFFSPQVDAATRTVSLVYDLKNVDGRLRVGQAVTLHVETQRAEDTLAIPESAIIEEGGQFVAFVQVAGETFQKRELKLGISGGGFAQVLEGISEGERVVTKGAYAIRLSSISGVIPAHGHAH